MDVDLTVEQLRELIQRTYKDIELPMTKIFLESIGVEAEEE